MGDSKALTALALMVCAAWGGSSLAIAVVVSVALIMTHSLLALVGLFAFLAPASVALRATEAIGQGFEDAEEQGQDSAAEPSDAEQDSTVA